MSSDTPLGSQPDPDGSAKASSSPLEAERESELPLDAPANGAAGAASDPAAAEEAIASLADGSAAGAALGSDAGAADETAAPLAETSAAGAAQQSAAVDAVTPAESAAAVTAEAPQEASEEAPESDPDTHRFECRSCGFVYDPEEGVRKLGIEAGTAFAALDPASFRCPVCRSRVGAFKDIGPRNKPSGFEENLNFGLGVNRLTPGQKNVLIFGGFALAFAFFLSLYSLR